MSRAAADSTCDERRVGGVNKPDVAPRHQRLPLGRSADGHRSRHLTRSQRQALTQAIAQLEPASLPLFAGTCPIA